MLPDLKEAPPFMLVVMQDSARADLDCARRLLDKAFMARLKNPCLENEFEYDCAMTDLRDSLAVAQEWMAPLHG